MSSPEDQADRARSDAIDSLLAEEARKVKREAKVSSPLYSYLLVWLATGPTPLYLPSHPIHPSIHDSELESSSVVASIPFQN